MLYRTLDDPAPPADANLENLAAALERDERHLRVLARLTQIAMDLAEALGEAAKARIETGKTEDRPPAPTDTATIDAFNTIAQTVRRTVALEAKLAEGVKTRRAGLIAERAARDEAHVAAKNEAIIFGLHDAYAGSTSGAEYEALIDRLMEDAEEHLRDADEFRGYLDRPVGETVAKLCAALGLDPDSCTPDGDAWRIRRPTTEFEMLLDERARKFGGLHDLPPSPSWGGTDGEAVRVGPGRQTSSA
jgi:hypothetical protein